MESKTIGKTAFKIYTNTDILKLKCIRHFSKHCEKCLGEVKGTHPREVGALHRLFYLTDNDCLTEAEVPFAEQIDAEKAKIDAENAKALAAKDKPAKKKTK